MEMKMKNMIYKNTCVQFVFHCCVYIYFVIFLNNTSQAATFAPHLLLNTINSKYYT